MYQSVQRPETKIRQVKTSVKHLFSYQKEGVKKHIVGDVKRMTRKRATPSAGLMHPVVRCIT